LHKNIHTLNVIVLMGLFLGLCNILPGKETNVQNDAKTNLINPEASLLLEEIARFQADHGGIRLLGEFSPDGRWIVFPEKTDLKLVNWKTRRVERIFKAKPVNTTKKVKQQSTDFGFGGPRLVIKDTDYVTTFAFSPCGKYLAAGGREDYLFNVWRISDGKRIITASEDPCSVIETEDITFRPCARRIEFSSNGKLLVLGESFGIVRVWNFPDPTEHRFISPDGQSEIRSLSISPDGKLLAFCDKHNVSLWGFEGKRLQSNIPTAGGTIVVCFSPAENIFAYVSMDAIVLYDADKKKELDRWSDLRGHIVSLAFSPDGTYLFAIIDITLMDVLKGKYKKRGQQVDKQQSRLSVFNVKTGKQVGHYDTRLLAGTNVDDHARSTDISISPDGSILSLCYGKQIILYKNPYTLLAHQIKRGKDGQRGEAGTKLIRRR